MEPEQVNTEVIESIEIPENQKYILCLLNSKGYPSKYIVFNGNSTPMTDEQIKQKLLISSYKQKMSSTKSPR